MPAALACSSAVASCTDELDRPLHSVITLRMRVPLGIPPGPRWGTTWIHFETAPGAPRMVSARVAGGVAAPPASTFRSSVDQPPTSACSEVGDGVVRTISEDETPGCSLYWATIRTEIRQLPRGGVTDTAPTVPNQRRDGSPVADWSSS